MSTFYQLLDIPSTATQEEIKKAYIKQAVKLLSHPDRNDSSQESTSKFQLIAQAYTTLSDPVKRARYDADLADIKRSSQSSSSADINPHQLFASLVDDLLIPEVPNPIYFYQPIGLIAGACLGMIIFNIPGACIGGWYGSKAGKVRDLKGKSVYDAFQSLSKEKKAAVLASLATKLLTGIALPSATK